MIPIAYIEERSDQYYSIKNEIIKSLKERRLIPFLGAGISMAPPSCLPSANNITEPIIDLLFQSVNDFNCEWIFRPN